MIFSALDRPDKRLLSIWHFNEMVTRFLEEGATGLAPQTIRRHKQVFKNQLVPYVKKISIKAIGPRA